MARELVYRSLDLRNVEPVLVSPSAGSDPSAAVAWSELESGLSQKIGMTDLIAALATLFEEVLLTGGVTEQRNGDDGTPYFFTRFEHTVPGWTNDSISEIALIERDTRIQRDYAHTFRPIGPGRFMVEFQSKRANPVLPDDAYVVRVHCFPNNDVLGTPAVPGYELLASPDNNAPWLATQRDRVGEERFLSLVNRFGVSPTGFATAYLKNGNELSFEWGFNKNFPEIDAYLGLV
jgi:hypothetical protein